MFCFCFLLLLKVFDQRINHIPGYTKKDIFESMELEPLMTGHGIIEPVTGHGKGKYRFKLIQESITGGIR